MFPASRVLHLNPGESDHLPILLEVRTVQSRNKKRGRGFRFDERWPQDAECRDVIVRSWESGLGSNFFMKVKDKIKRTRDALQKWSSTKFGSLRRDIEETRSKLASFYDRGSSQEVNARLQLEMLEVIPRVISDEINSELTREVDREEVHRALRQMHPSKSPGPDVLSPCFYQKFWDIVGSDVVEAVRCFLVSDEQMASINKTFVTLIPKVPVPKHMSQLRPISLCNVLYKLSSKVLANRLKPIMDKIISPFQGAFVPGRLISDNSLLAFEIAHHMKNRRSGKKGYCALKLDMSKAYDRVEWLFLEVVMRRLGFCEIWVRQILRCVSTVSYSFLLNGSPRGLLHPGRGLRQGDALSPYLFLFCGEVFSKLLCMEEERGKLRGVEVCRGAPSISHLLFADDSFIFCRAETMDCVSLMGILKAYEMISGQQINLQKSAVSFSKNVVVEEQERLADLMGVRRVEKHDKYLGVPVEVSYSKEEAFGYLVERVKQRTQGWREKLLSAAGKEILIKAVIQAIPTYVMNCFELPKYLCDDMHKLMAQFWWGDKEGKAKIHWLSWDKLCRSKRKGGLGFKNMHDYNLALLAKQGWRILQHPDNIVSRVLKAKYFLDSDFMDAKLKSGASFIWRSIMAGRQVLAKGVRYQVVNGENIFVWYDKWIPIPYRFRPFSEPMDGLEELKVADLIDPDDRAWQVHLLQELFTQHEVDLIAKIPLSCRAPSDRLVWHFDKRGRYNVKSGYWAWRLASKATDQASSSSNAIGGEQGRYWSCLWKINVSAKIKMFVWRLLRDIIPTRVALANRKVNVSDMHCLLCGVVAETGAHLFKECAVVKAFWRQTPLRLVLPTFSDVSLVEWCWLTLEALNKDQQELFLSCLWAIWSERNKVFWHRVSFNCSFLAQWVVQFLGEYKKVHVKAHIRQKRGKMKWECPLPEQVL
ncbi:hypothetical protein ACLB2K_022254 [Fragaria x ananassa]